jgi:hypothetical protein
VSAWCCPKRVEIGEWAPCVSALSSAELASGVAEGWASGGMGDVGVAEVEEGRGDVEATVAGREGGVGVHGAAVEVEEADREEEAAAGVTRQP